MSIVPSSNKNQHPDFFAFLRAKFQKLSRNTLFLSIAFFAIFSGALTIFAAPPATPYNPGETLDPSCAPGSSNCSVQTLPPQTGADAGKFLTTDGTTTSWVAVSGSGSVTSVSSGNLSPLFTTSVANPTTAASISYTLSNAGAHTFFGNFTGSSGVPSFGSPILASADFANQGTTTQVLHGNAAGNPTWSQVSLTTDVSGTLPVLQGGTGATTLTGLLIGNGTSAFTATTTSAGISGQ
ncbi:MAG: hypothetical protein WC795_00775, partial [Candidatus Paceibacterota bacterium]